MRWRAKLKNGSIVKEVSNGVSSRIADIDANSILEIIIAEDSDRFNITYESDTGIVDFKNLDIESLGSVPDGETYSMVFDANTGCFRFDPASAEKLKSVMLVEEYFYFNIKWRCDGLVSVESKDHYYTFEKDGILYHTVGGTLDNISYKKHASRDFNVRFAGGLGKKDRTQIHSYELTDTRKILIGTNECFATHNISYDLMTRRVLSTLTLETDTTFECKAVLNSSEGKPIRNVIKIKAGVPYVTSKVLCLV
jgi:hypothetical protein